MTSSLGNPNQLVKQVVIVPQAAIKGNTLPEKVAFFHENGTPAAPAGTFTPAAHQPNSVAVDVPTLVADFNALLAKLQAAGLMA